MLSSSDAWCGININDAVERMRNLVQETKPLDRQQIIMSPDVFSMLGTSAGADSLLDKMQVTVSPFLDPGTAFIIDQSASVFDFGPTLEFETVDINDKFFVMATEFLPKISTPAAFVINFEGGYIGGRERVSVKRERVSIKEKRLQRRQGRLITSRARRAINKAYRQSWRFA